MTIDRSEEGIVKIPSKHSVGETMDRLRGILKSKQITLFVLIDHSGEAAMVAQKGPPSWPLPAALLPLKVLFSEDEVTQGLSLRS